MFTSVILMRGPLSKSPLVRLKVTSSYGIEDDISDGLLADRPTSSGHLHRLVASYDMRGKKGSIGTFFLCPISAWDMKLFTY